MYDISADEIIRRLRSNPLEPDQTQAVADLRKAFVEFGLHLAHALPAGRYKSIAVAHLEDASMYAVKALTHDGI